MGTFIEFSEAVKDMLVNEGTTEPWGTSSSASGPAIHRGSA